MEMVEWHLLLLINGKSVTTQIQFQVHTKQKEIGQHTKVFKGQWSMKDAQRSCELWQPPSFKTLSWKNCLSFLGFFKNESSAKSNKLYFYETEQLSCSALICCFLGNTQKRKLVESGDFTTTNPTLHTPVTCRGWRTFYWVVGLRKSNHYSRQRRESAARWK